MLSIVPAVVGVPGGIELVVIFFVMFLLFGVPVALALILGYRYVKGQAGEEERIAELEAELADLRDTVEENSTTGSTTGSTSTRSPNDSTNTRSPTDSTGTGSPSDSTNTNPSSHADDSPVDSATNQGVKDDE